MQKIVPHLWFDTEALEAARLYVSLFEDSKILNTAMLYDTPSGDAQTVEFQLAGFKFAAISAGPYFAFNPSISLMVACETKEEVEYLYKSLIEGGSELMPLGKYDFSQWYAWVSDKYGLNWQIMLVENINEHKKIRPCLLFGMEVCGKTQDAIDYYSAIFSESKVGYVNPYLEGQAADQRAKINYAELEIFSLEMVMMDHGYGGDATFNEAISFMIRCEDQKEIDYYWEKLSFVPEAEACGWVKDQFGLSWQVIPKMMDAFKNYIDSMESMVQRNRMIEILSWVKENFPNLDEVIKWNQPMFMDHDTFIIGFSIAKNHMSFSPEEYGITVFLKDIEKSGYEHTKGIVKIKWTQEVDYPLLHRIIQFNIEDKRNCKTFFRK